jgi:hypothetical protein
MKFLSRVYPLLAVALVGLTASIAETIEGTFSTLVDRQMILSFAFAIWSAVVSNPIETPHVTETKPAVLHSY